MTKRKFSNLTQTQTFNNTTPVVNYIKPFTYYEINQYTQINNILNNKFLYHCNDKFHDKPLNIIQFIEIYK